MAIPSVLLQLAKNSPMMGQINQMMNTIRTAQNPTALLNQMTMNNPNLKKVIDIVQQYGGDSNKAFYETAKQMGVDPNEIISMMK